MINKENIEKHIKELFGKDVKVNISKLGEGVQGAGFLVEMDRPEGTRQYVIKGLFPEGLGHDFPSDRAGVFLLDLDEFKNLPKHVKALDVLAEMKDGAVRSIGGGREYYLLMERAEGRHYFNDLSGMAEKEELDNADIDRIEAMTSYLADIHKTTKDSKALYWRKIRDTIGHGECLMGVFDTYPDGTISYKEMSEIEKGCLDWRVKLKPKFKRLCQIHGDFHPGNIWFKGDRDFILLDRSRGPWGDAADDVTALTINYIFFSISRYGKVVGPYLQALKLFYHLYIKKTGDNEIYKVVAPFYAFRGAVIANPVFYPELTKTKRRMIFNFMHNVLRAKSFDPEKVNDYLIKAEG